MAQALIIGQARVDEICMVLHACFLHNVYGRQVDSRCGGVDDGQQQGVVRMLQAADGPFGSIAFVPMLFCQAPAYIGTGSEGCVVFLPEEANETNEGTITQPIDSVVAITFFCLHLLHAAHEIVGLLRGGYGWEEAHHFGIATDGSHEGDIRICPAAEAEALRGKEVW